MIFKIEIVDGGAEVAGPGLSHVAEAGGDIASGAGEVKQGATRN